MSLPIETATLKPRSWIFIFVLVIVLIVYDLAVQKSNIEGIHFIFPIIIGIILLIWAGFRKVALIIDNEGLTSKSAFSSKEILWKDITQTYLKYQHHGKSGNMYWYFNTPAQPHFSFSTGFYSRKSLQTIAQAVVEKCEKAEIEERIWNMTEGRFPWYIF